MAATGKNNSRVYSVKDHYLVFSENLQKYMDLKGVDRNTLASGTGFKYTTISEWLKGTNYPSQDKIARLANYFRIRSQDLIFEADDEYDVFRKEAFDAKRNNKKKLGELIDVLLLLEDSSIDILLTTAKALPKKHDE